MIIYLCTVIILSNNTLFSAAKKGVSFPVTRSERGRRQGKVLGTSGSRTNTVAGQVPETCLPPLQGAHARSRATRLFRPPRHLRGTKQPRIRISLASSIELFHYLSPFPLHILAEIAPCGPGTGVWSLSLSLSPRLWTTRRPIQTQPPTPAHPPGLNPDLSSLSCPRPGRRTSSRSTAIPVLPTH